MKTIALDIQDDYCTKFVSLLKALPKGAMRVVEAPKGSLSKETLSRIEEYKSGSSDISPINDEFWDDMDRHIDSFAK